MTSTTCLFFPSISERSSYPVDLNFFVTLALTGYGCLREYLYRFKLFHSPSCSYSDVSQNITHILYSCPCFDVLQSVLDVSSNSHFLSPPFLKVCRDSDALSLEEGTIFVALP